MDIMKEQAEWNAKLEHCQMKRDKPQCDGDCARCGFNEEEHARRLEVLRTVDMRLDKKGKWFLDLRCIAR